MMCDDVRGGARCDVYLEERVRVDEGGAVGVLLLLVGLFRTRNVREFTLTSFSFHRHSKHQ